MTLGLILVIVCGGLIVLAISWAIGESIVGVDGPWWLALGVGALVLGTVVAVLGGLYYGLALMEKGR